MAKSRRSNGQFRQSYWSQFAGLIVLVVSMCIGYIIQEYYKDAELLSPYVSTYTIRAVEPEPTPSPTPKPKNNLEELVYQYFGEDSQEAIKIMFCESRNNNQTTGDKHLMLFDEVSQEMVGDSIGLFQVRTGGEGWNRARANNMTADEFRVYLRNPENNIKYAKDIFDRRGWNAWFNCMNKVLINRGN